jgi:TRAP-type C4-dicarboxylate transport system permease small subunit
MSIIVALIIMEIALRSIFNVSTMVASEFSGYMLVAVVALGLGYTMQHRAHIRITIFWDRFTDEWKRRADIILACLSAAICLFFLYHSVIMVYETYSLGMQADTIAETPLWIPQTSIPIGVFLLFLQLVALIIRSIRA